MIGWLLILPLIGASGGESAPLDAGAFKALMATALAPVRDFELICEGRIERVDTTDPQHDKKAAGANRLTQAVFAYRASDGASHLDLYEKALAEGQTFIRTTMALRNGEVTTIRSVPDSSLPAPGPQVDIGGPGSLDVDGSPERFVRLYFFRRLIDHPVPFRLTDEGWDEVEGRRCLRVKLEEFPGIDAWDLWIDVERGGNVLQADYHRDNLHWLRIHSVRLQAFDQSGGEAIWFPVHAVYDTYLSGYHSKDHPVLRETYDIVQGSLALNRGLRDERFSIEWNDTRLQSDGLREIRDSFRKAQARPRPSPPPYMNAAEVEKDLKSRLETAQRQAEPLDASPPGGHSWGSGQWVELTLAIAGVVALAVALVMRQRR